MQIANDQLEQFFCPACGYDLRGIASDRCPECGEDVDRSTLGQSVLPWRHRARLGRYRAFRKTVRMASFRPRELARELTCPANFRDAVIFRRLVVLHAVVPLALLASTGYFLLLFNSGAEMWSNVDRLGSVIQWLMFPVIWICLALFFFAATGVASYFFHPKTLPIVQQNRAIAVSYYACAPLAYTPITLLIFGGGIVLSALLMPTGRAGVRDALLWLIALTPIGLQIAAIIRVPVLLLGSTTHCSAARRWTLGIVLPISWAIAGFVLLVILPLAIYTLGLMIVSLRRG